jgi:hypothetical protein
MCFIFIIRCRKYSLVRMYFVFNILFLFFHIILQCKRAYTRHKKMGFEDLIGVDVSQPRATKVAGAVSTNRAEKAGCGGVHHISCATICKLFWAIHTTYGVNMRTANYYDYGMGFGFPVACASSLTSGKVFGCDIRPVYQTMQRQLYLLAVPYYFHNASLYGINLEVDDYEIPDCLDVATLLIGSDQNIYDGFFKRTEGKPNLKVVVILTADNQSKTDVSYKMGWRQVEATFNLHYAGSGASNRTARLFIRK